MDWAIGRYKAAKNYRPELAIKMEKEWFDTAIIQYWFDNHDEEILARMMEHLPTTHFTRHTAAIIEGWEEWNGILAQHAAPLLLQVSTEDSLRVIEDYIRNDFTGLTGLPKQLAVIRLLPLLPEKDREKLRSMIEGQIIKLEDNSFEKQRLIQEFLEFDSVTSRAPDYLMKLTQNYILEYMGDEDNNFDIFQALSKKLFGTDALFVHAISMIEESAPRSFENIQPFFAKNAPLKKCDTLLSLENPWRDTVRFLEEYEPTASEILPIIEAVQSRNDFAHYEFAAFAIAAILNTFHLETMDASGLPIKRSLELLCWDVYKNPHIPVLTEALRQSEPDEVGAAINDLMPQLWEEWGCIPLSTLAGELRLDNTIPVLVEAISDKKGDYLCEAASAALNLLGEPAQQAVIAQWDSLDMSQKIYGLSAVKNQGGQPALDFAIAHFKEFSDDRHDLEMWLELVKAIPDRSIIKLLEPETRYKNPFMDEAFYILCTLTGYGFNKLEEIHSRILVERTKRENRMAKLMEGHFSSFENDELSLPLKCDKCGEINYYEVDSVMTSGKPTTEGFFVREEFPCLDCGQWPDFELTEDATKMVMTRSMIEYKFSNDQENYEGLLDFSKAQYRFRTRPVPDILAELKRDIAQHPQSIAYLLRFARFHAALDRPHRAAEYYRKALQLEPNAIEACVGLAQTEFDNGLDNQSFNTLSPALEQKEKWKFFRPHELPEKIVTTEFASLYNSLRSELKRLDIPALSPASLTLATGSEKAPKKIGRNDPCSCGSGKKYKKCCL